MGAIIIRTIIVFVAQTRFSQYILSITAIPICAGIALLIAALSADGTSEISNIAQIDRGYENIEGRLNALGARIRRN